MSDAPKIRNGQVWRQLDFPCCSRLLIMGGSFPGDDYGPAVWILASTPGLDGPSMACTERNGKWLYTKEEILEHLRKYKYTLVEEEYVCVERSFLNEICGELQLLQAERKAWREH